jgi:hypothetical protein
MTASSRACIIRRMAFHPRRFLHESGLHHAGRSLPVMAGGILVFVGGLLSVIALVAWTSDRGRGAEGAMAPAGFALVLGVTLAVAAAGVYVLVRGLRQVGVARRLMRDGVRVEGRVLAVRASNMTVNHRTQVIVRFRYRDRDGQAREGDSWPVEPGEGWSPGDTGVVCYDPADPASALWIGREP